LGASSLTAEVGSPARPPKSMARCRLSSVRFTPPFFALLICIPFLVVRGPSSMASTSRAPRWHRRSAPSWTCSAGHPLHRVWFMGFYSVRPIVIALGVNAQGFRYLSVRLSCWQSWIYTLRLLPKYRVHLHGTNQHEGGAYSLGGHPVGGDTAHQLPPPPPRESWPPTSSRWVRALGETMAGGPC